MIYAADFLKNSIAAYCFAFFDLALLIKWIEVPVDLLFERIRIKQSED